MAELWRHAQLSTHNITFRNLTHQRQIARLGGGLGRNLCPHKLGLGLGLGLWRGRGLGLGRQSQSGRADADSAMAAVVYGN